MQTINAADNIDVWGRPIGVENPCFIAAEVGLNHNGDIDLAKEHIREAAKAGVDAVKFQNYRTRDFVHDRSITYTYKSEGREVTDTEWNMFKSREPDAAWWPELIDLTRRLGLVFFSTPTGTDGIDELVELGAPLIKNGSDYLTNLPFLEHLGQTGLPLVISTGMADMEDVETAMAAIRRGGDSPIILLHCTSSYPTPVDQTNLRRMMTLQNRYGVPVGFSDHTKGHEAACQAVTLGACFVEKHFTLSHDLPGPDHWFSATPEEIKTLVDEIRDAEARLGNPDIAPAEVEAQGRKMYRIGLVAANDLAAGTRLDNNHIALRRPGSGLLPKDLEQVIGRKLRRSLRTGAPIHETDLDTD